MRRPLGNINQYPDINEIYMFHGRDYVLIRIAFEGDPTRLILEYISLEEYRQRYMLPIPGELAYPELPAPPHV
jgi:hypothetical protein